MSLNLQEIRKENIEVPKIIQCVDAPHRFAILFGCLGKKTDIFKKSIYG